MEENKSIGAVKWPVLKLYLGSMGSWGFWIVACLVFGLQQLSGVASNVWIKEWANQYSEEAAVKQYPTHGYGANSYAAGEYQSVQNPALIASISNFGGNSTMLRTSTIPEVNVKYYLFVLALIGMAGAIAAFFRDLWIFFGSLTASWKLHNRLMSAVSGAQFKFFRHHSAGPDDEPVQQGPRGRGPRSSSSCHRCHELRLGHCGHRCADRRDHPRLPGCRPFHHPCLHLPRPVLPLQLPRSQAARVCAPQSIVPAVWRDAQRCNHDPCLQR